MVSAGFGSVRFVSISVLETTIKSITQDAASMIRSNSLVRLLIVDCDDPPGLAHGVHVLLHAWIRVLQLLPADPSLTSINLTYGPRRKEEGGGEGDKASPVS